MVADSKITEFKNIIQDSDITDANTEILFDAAANTYNIFGCDVPNMTGTAGSKTVTYTPGQKGAVFQGARVIYVSFYKNPANQSPAAMGQVNLSSQDLMSNSTVWGMLKEIAAELKDQEAEIPRVAFRVGHATS